MVLETELTRALGIRYPVVQGGMMWVGLPKLAAAVSNAGGLGIITALTQPTPEDLRKAIRETKKLTNKPFGVNLTILPTMKPPPYEEYARVVIDERVPVAETVGGKAAGPIIKLYKDNGIYVIHKCTTIRHAQSAEKLGVDMISMDGFECAGHPGEEDIPNLILAALAAKHLKIPYLVSGGVADGRGLAAALSLGAVGVNLGTRFMAVEESHLHPNIKQKMIDAHETDTTHIFRTMNNTARVFKNSVAKEVVAMERRPQGAKFSEIAHLVAGARGKTVYETGQVDAGIWWASPVLGLIEDVPTCKALLERMEKEAEASLSKATSYIKASSKL